MESKPPPSEANNLADFDNGCALIQIRFLAIWHLRRNGELMFPREPEKWVGRDRNILDVARRASGSGN